MTVRYLDRFDDGARRTVSTMGLQPGPGGGDGWSIVSVLSAQRLADSMGIAGSHRMAFFVTGRIVNLQRFGTLPANATGRVQLCLADGAGLRSPVHLVELSVQDLQGADRGMPFAFLLAFPGTTGSVGTFGGSLNDPTWGAAWPGVDDLQLEARGWWVSDAPTYGVQFDVVDVTWIWADLEAIPSTDQFTTVLQPTTPAVASATWAAATAHGNGGEKWLHFWTSYYRPGIRSAASATVPRLQLGHRTVTTPGTFIIRVGNSTSTGSGAFPHRLGLGNGRGTQPLARAMGSFFAGELTDAVKSEFQAVDGSLGQTSSAFSRTVFFGLRLDNLPTPQILEAPTVYSWPTPFTVNFGERWTSATFLPREVPLLERTADPWVLVTGIPYRFAPSAFSTFLRADDGRELAAPIGFDLCTETEEGTPTFASSPTGISAADGPDAYRYEVRIAHDGQVITTGRPVRDFFLVAFHPVKDPDNVPGVIPSVGAGVGIIPGTEGLDPSALTDLPVQPNQESFATSPVGARLERLKGAGYLRTWSTWLRARRPFDLAWSPITLAQLTALLAFLRATPTFRVRPNRGQLIAVTRTGPFTWQQVTPNHWAVACPVAELVYVTP